MKKCFSVLMTAVLLVVICCLPGTVFAAAAPTVVVDSASILAGDTATLNVTLSGNTGIAFLALVPQMSEGLTVTSVSNGELISDFTKGENYIWVNAEDVTADGVLCTLTVQAAADAYGELRVSFLVGECYTAAFADVAVEVQSGTVTVTPAPIETSMLPINSVYQYVGGGEDNSSLNGVATEGSAVYSANGKIYTAFRIPAHYVTDSADFSTVVLDGVSYPIVERGLILGTEGQELTVDSPVKVVVTGNFRNKHWKYDPDSGIVTYSVLVKNVLRTKINIAYVARSYVKVLNGNVKEIIYSETSVPFTPQQLYDATVEALAAEGKPAPLWFTLDRTDDGVIDIE